MTPLTWFGYNLLTYKKIKSECISPSSFLCGFEKLKGQTLKIFSKLKPMNSRYSLKLRTAGFSAQPYSGRNPHLWGHLVTKLKNFDRSDYILL